MIRPITPQDVAAVAAKMRDIDRREICALSVSDDPVVVTSILSHFAPLGATVWKDDEPICVVGAMMLWPGVYSVFMFATDRWLEVVIEATRFVRNTLLPTLRDAGAHRLQCYSLAEHTDAHQWLRYLGADREMPEPKYGKNKENFILFSMSQDALARVTFAKK